MGFDEKFIRTWEYYFDYCAAGFRTYTLGDYQVELINDVLVYMLISVVCR